MSQLQLDIEIPGERRMGSLPDGCRCTCERPYPAAHKLSGCEHCDCPVTTRPSEAVELSGHLHLEDESIVFYEFESHWLGFEEGHPHVEFWGPVSSTGYWSHFGLIGYTSGDWVAEIREAAERRHAEWMAERAKKSRGKQSKTGSK